MHEVSPRRLHLADAPLHLRFTRRGKMGVLPFSVGPYERAYVTVCAAACMCQSLDDRFNKYQRY